MTDIRETLSRQQYVQVPIPLPRAVLEDAIQAFFAFLAQPEDIKQHIDFKLFANHRRGDIGYKRRRSEDGVYDDDKEFFHFQPAILERYADFLKDHPIVADFMIKAHPVWQVARDIGYDILNQFEADYPGTCAKIFDTPHPHVILRFLRYHWAQSGKYLAKPHFDAGAFTLALAESDPGLRIGHDPDSLTPVVHQDGSALFFFSSNHRNVVDTDAIKPAWHDVIQTDETHIGKPYARWAVVAFFEAAGVEALPRSETHKYYK